MQPSHPLPVVTMSSIPETQRDILELKIHKDSQHLMEQYATLQSQTEHYLDQIHCDVKKLVVCVMDVRHVKRLSKLSPLVELRNATTISGVFIELTKKNLISFLQFSILKCIITVLCFGSRELQEKLKVYEGSFNRYIKRRVCETRIYQEGRFEAFTGNDSEKKVELLLITDENWDDSIKFVTVSELEGIVADSLDVNNFSLQIVRIDRGK